MSCLSPRMWCAPAWSLAAPGLWVPLPPLALQVADNNSEVWAPPLSDREALVRELHDLMGTIAEAAADLLMVDFTTRAGWLEEGRNFADMAALLKVYGKPLGVVLRLMSRIDLYLERILDWWPEEICPAPEILLGDTLGDFREEFYCILAHPPQH